MCCISICVAPSTYSVIWVRKRSNFSISPPFFYSRFFLPLFFSDVNRVWSHVAFRGHTRVVCDPALTAQTKILSFFLLPIVKFGTLFFTLLCQKLKTTLVYKSSDFLHDLLLCFLAFHFAVCNTSGNERRVLRSPRVLPFSPPFVLHFVHIKRNLFLY